MTLTVGSLFTGIGGFDLGFERAGMQIKWQCEVDPYCRAVLHKHWPSVTCYGDITELRQPPYVDILCGGFPCQDISAAGRGAGIDGARSGLWSEYARIIGEVRPRFVVVENVPVLRSRGLGRVLGEMAALGYDAEWDCIPACAIGAPHRRDRIWIVGYPNSTGSQGHRGSVTSTRERSAAATGRGSREGSLADADRIGRRSREDEGRHATDDGGEAGHEGWWLVEPDVGRVADGVPSRVDRLRSLGNALVPQIAEAIGRRLTEIERGGTTRPAHPFTTAHSQEESNDPNRETSQRPNPRAA